MLNHSTFKLETNIESPNFRTPWAVGGGSASSATVTLIEHQGEIYFVTNAHAVINSTYLKIKLNQNSTEFPVETCWFDPILDLAILKLKTLEAEELIKKTMQPLTLVPEFQKQGTEVFAYGYPSGGRTLSFTKGNISRVELSSMAISGSSAIMVQTSAPINPGNSGGPITRMFDNIEKCIGIVAQGAQGLQNTGYFIPAITVIQTIERYLKFGRFQKRGWIEYVTAPELSFNWQTLKNQMLRKSLGLPQTPIGEELTGIRVSRVSSNSCAYGLLQEADIIQTIDGIPIQSNGQIQVAELEYPIAFNYIVLQKKYVDTLTLGIQRLNLASQQLETMEIKIILNRMLGQYKCSPAYSKPLKYHVQPSGDTGGYVFIRLTAAYRSGFPKQSYPPFFSGMMNLEDEQTREVVVLQSIIPSEETDGYESFAVTQGASCQSHQVIEANGQKITNLYDLITALSDSSKPSEVKFRNGRVLYIAPATSLSMDSLRKSHQISSFTSEQSIKIERPTFQEIKSFGIRDNNRFSFLKQVTTKCSSESLANRLKEDNIGNEEQVIPQLL